MTKRHSGHVLEKRLAKEAIGRIVGCVEGGLVLNVGMVPNCLFHDGARGRPVELRQWGMGIHPAAFGVMHEYVRRQKREQCRRQAGE